jgi:hypothetical protein
METDISRKTPGPTELAAEVISPSEPDFFGPPPLIVGEDPAAYAALWDRVANAVLPKDILEDIWLRDVVDLTWEVFRSRRLKAHLLHAAAHEGIKMVLAPLVWDKEYRAKGSAAEELSELWARREENAVKEVNARLAAAGLTMDAVMAQTFAAKLDEVERIDRMIASAEARRNLVLREVERHRETLAATLRRATEEAEDAEFEEIAPAGADAAGQ